MLREVVGVGAGLHGCCFMCAFRCMVLPIGSYAFTVIAKLVTEL